MTQLQLTYIIIFLTSKSSESRAPFYNLASSTFHNIGEFSNRWYHTWRNVKCHVLSRVRELELALHGRKFVKKSSQPGLQISLIILYKILQYGLQINQACLKVTSHRQAGCNFHLWALYINIKHVTFFSTHSKLFRQYLCLLQDIANLCLWQPAIVGLWRYRFPKTLGKKLSNINFL